MKRTSSNQELIQSMFFFFREIERSRNLNFSSNHKINVTIIFQARCVHPFKPEK